MSTVPWSTPHMRAERALMAAAELMSFKRIPEARSMVREAIVQMRELVRALEAEEAAAIAIEEARREFDRKLRGEHTGP